jgi:DNA topoisomerase-2
MKIFRPEDAPVLEYRRTTVSRSNPFYVPIIPMVLVNSSIGIGTGFSTCIPSFDPLTRQRPKIRTVRRTTTDDTQVSRIKGAITAIPDDNGNVQKWSSSGIKRRVTEKAIEIIELPVGVDGRLQDVPGGRSR